MSILGRPRPIAPRAAIGVRTSGATVRRTPIRTENETAAVKFRAPTETADGSDADLAQRVRLNLQQRRLPSAGSVSIGARNGVIVVTGHVPSEYEKVSIKEQVERVPGVERVVASLTVTKLQRIGDDVPKRGSRERSFEVPEWVNAPWAWVAVAGIVGVGAGWFLRGPSQPTTALNAPLPRPVVQQALPVVAPAPVDAVVAESAPVVPESVEVAASPPPEPVPVAIVSTSTELVGQLVASGEPAQGALMTFIPVQEGVCDPILIIVRDADGTFEIPRKNLPVGGPYEFLVTAQWNPIVGEGEDSYQGPNVLPPKLSKRETTPLRVSLSASSESMAPIAVAITNNNKRR